MEIYLKPIRSRVVTNVDAQANPTLREDSYWEKVMRYIPGEIVAAYVAAASMVSSATDVPTKPVLWVITIVLVIVTPIWIYYATDVPDRPKPILQTIAATIGFMVWVFAIGGPFVYFEWYRPLYGSLLLILATLLMPKIETPVNRVASHFQADKTDHKGVVNA